MEKIIYTDGEIVFNRQRREYMQREKCLIGREENTYRDRKYLKDNRREQINKQQYSRYREEHLYSERKNI